jgi:hypothetical protein
LWCHLEGLELPPPLLRWHHLVEALALVLPVERALLVLVPEVAWVLLGEDQVLGLVALVRQLDWVVGTGCSHPF